MTLHRYKSGEVILRENEAGDTAYIIEQGRVEIIKELDDRYVHLAYLGVGQTFGEMSMIDDKPRSATVKAVEDTLVREIHRDNFFDTLRQGAYSAARPFKSPLRALTGNPESHFAAPKSQSTIRPRSHERAAHGTRTTAHRGVA